MSSDVPTTDFSALLNEARETLVSQLSERGFGAEGETGLEYDANFADSSQVTAERGETDVLVAELRSALHEIERALERLDKGTYGVCERCANPISVARLEAMPATTTCITCASLQR
jgi:RNA polymerase-binding transcription factor DksA